MPSRMEKYNCGSSLSQSTPMSCASHVSDGPYQPSGQMRAMALLEAEVALVLEQFGLPPLVGTGRNEGYRLARASLGRRVLPTKPKARQRALNAVLDLHVMHAVRACSAERAGIRGREAGTATASRPQSIMPSQARNHRPPRSSRRCGRIRRRLSEVRDRGRRGAVPGSRRRHRSTPITDTSLSNSLQSLR